MKFNIKNLSLAIIGLMLSLQLSLINKKEAGVASEVMSNKYFKHDWDSENYSLSENKLDEIFDASVVNNSSNAIMVIFYDGGECNPYIDTVLSEIELITDFNKVLITNQNQSYIDTSLADYNSCVRIIGDESRYLSKKLNIYNKDIERSTNVVLFYKNGSCVYEADYSPRIKGELSRVIKEYKKIGSF